jgi:hypothetical protein
MVKLNISCGSDSREGYINIDITNDVKADLYIMDENEIFKRSYRDIDEIILYRVLPYFKDETDFLSKCHRILKIGGIIRLRVPYISSLPYSMNARRPLSYRITDFIKFREREEWIDIPKNIHFNIKIRFKFKKPFNLIEGIINRSEMIQFIYENYFLHNIMIPKYMGVDMIKTGKKSSLFKEKIS